MFLSTSYFDLGFFFVVYAWLYIHTIHTIPYHTIPYHTSSLCCFLITLARISGLGGAGESAVCLRVGEGVYMLLFCLCNMLPQIFFFCPAVYFFLWMSFGNRVTLGMSK